MYVYQKYRFQLYHISVIEFQHARNNKVGQSSTYLAYQTFYFINL